MIKCKKGLLHQFKGSKALNSVQGWLGRLLTFFGMIYGILDAYFMLN